VNIKKMAKDINSKVHAINCCALL